MNTRIPLAGIAIPAIMLAASPVASAGPINVSFNPGLSGMGVTIVDTVAAGRQNCNYTANPQGISLLQPVSRSFQLDSGGSTTLSFGGVPTGTIWSVGVDCTYADPAPVAAPPPAPGGCTNLCTGGGFNPRPADNSGPRPPAGSFHDVVTY